MTCHNYVNSLSKTLEGLKAILHKPLYIRLFIETPAYVFLSIQSLRAANKTKDNALGNLTSINFLTLAGAHLPSQLFIFKT